MNYIYISIVLLCVIIIICLIFIFSRKKSTKPKEAVSSSYLTKDELSNVIIGKLCIRPNIESSDSSLQYKIYYNLDNTIKVYEIKNCIVQGVTTGTYKIISKNNDGYIEINFITIYESPNIESRFNKQHINSIHKTMQHIIGPFTLYQHSIKGQTLSYKSSDSNTYFTTVYPQIPNEAVVSSYLTKDELSNVIIGKISIYQSIDDSSILYKCYYNLDNTFIVETIKNGIIEGTTKGTYNIISKNNVGYIDNNFIKIDEPRDSRSKFNKQHPNSVYKTMKTIFGPYTLYQHNRNGVILSYNLYPDLNNTFFYTVFPLNGNNAL